MGNVRLRACVLLLGTALIASACASKVLIPPRLDLRSYGAVGMIQLASNDKGELAAFASQRLVQAIQSAQPGSRFLELGSEAQVLRKLGREQLDFETIRAIGEQYHVDAVLVGRLGVTDMKPNVQLSSMLTKLRASADVEATLEARLFETTSGATFWTRSSSGSKAVAAVKITSRGPVGFGTKSMEEAYGELVRGLVYRITADFRSHYE